MWSGFGRSLTSTVTFLVVYTLNEVCRCCYFEKNVAIKILGTGQGTFTSQKRFSLPKSYAAGEGHFRLTLGCKLTGLLDSVWKWLKAEISSLYRKNGVIWPLEVNQNHWGVVQQDTTSHCCRTVDTWGLRIKDVLERQDIFKDPGY